MQYITKTIYLEYLECAKNTWLKMHKPELSANFELSAFEKSLTANGNLVEMWARKLFPSGILIPEFGESAQKITKQYIEEKRPVIFQSTFIHDKFLARNDVLEYDKKNNCWNLYEIKGTNSLDENNDEIDHIEDATFQYIILSDLGIKVGQAYIIHLNKEYVRGDYIDINDLFVKDDITSQVLERVETTKEKMFKAIELLFQENEKTLECLCIYKGRSKHCSTFKYSHPEVPEYSIHDLSRIGNSKKKLAELVNLGVFDINDIPDGFKLSDNQQNQVEVHKTQYPIIQTQSIKGELESLVYPLYFFDYETYPSAIPLFKDFRPYQQIPFQFSLHVLESRDSELKHFEYIHMDASDPSEDIIINLRKTIGPIGNIIVWNKKFEKGRNEELAVRSPQNAEFLNDINNRIYDLMDIFQKQMHVHAGFKGSASIKKVLPVLVPELSYKDLEIHDGGMAMDAWFENIFNIKSEDKKQETAENLLKYCYLDTYAMYAIWRELINIIPSK
jgi:hypothetical protein